MSSPSVAPAAWVSVTDSFTVCGAAQVPEPPPVNVSAALRPAAPEGPCTASLFLCVRGNVTVTVTVTPSPGSAASFTM